MIKVMLFKKVFLIIGLLMVNISAFGSSTVEELGVEEKSSQLLCDVTILLSHIEKIIQDNGTAIYSGRKEISKGLKKLLSNESLLKPFPYLSVNTYNDLIFCLKAVLKEHKEKAAVILHLWSYMVGIPVVGLGHGRSYYDLDNHLLPQATSDECEDLELSISAPKFCVKIARKEGDVAEEKQQVIDLPSEAYVSALLFRKQRLRDSSLTELPEIQKVAWQLFENDLVPLQQLGNEQLVLFLRKSILKIHFRGDKKPFYPLGLINLFRNTAIYLSMEEGEDSDVIVSPCSKDTIRYFGLQDGVFIERGSLKRGTIHKLFGKQFFLRGLFRKNPCQEEYPGTCNDCISALKGLYEPHYSFFLLDDEGQRMLREIRSNAKYKNGLSVFVMDFTSYIEGRSVQESLSKKLLQYMSKQQLREILSETARLERFLFNPTFEIELSSTVGEHDDQEDMTWTAQKLMAVVVQHLRCIEHQDTVSINLSNNALTDDEIRILGRVLGKNILPDLEEMDLSHNSITRKGLAKLICLLKRDRFKTLKMGHNRVRSTPGTFQKEIADKIVWN